MSKKKYKVGRGPEGPLNQNFSCLPSPLVSKTLNIYANAINSCLCVSPARLFPNVNLPCRVLNLEGFSWQKGYRNPLAYLSYKKTYQKFLEALQLITLVREKGGKIYVLFDGDELRPPSSFLDPQKQINSKKNKLLHSNSKELPCSGKDFKGGEASPLVFPVNLYKNKTKSEIVYSWNGQKWVGGTFSNLKQVSKSINLYKTLSRQFFGILENQTSPRYFVMAKKYHGNLFYTNSKKNTKNALQDLHLPQNFQPPGHQIKSQQGQTDQLMGGRLKNVEFKAKSVYGSQSNITLSNQLSINSKEKNLPDLIIIENAERYKNVIAEAQTLKIPVIAFVESDILSNISIALPLNAYKHYFLAFLLHIVYKMPTF